MPRRFKSRQILSLVVTGALTFGACGGDTSSSTAPAQADSTAAATAAPEPTAAPTARPEPTATAPPTPTATPTPQPETLDLAVSTTEAVFVDETRTTDETKTHDDEIRPAADSRTIETTIYHPTSAGGETYPIVVVAHGFGDRREFYAPVAEPLSGRGYVVIVPDFPETSNSLSSSADFQEQPADVSFVLDNLDAVAPEVAAMADENSIGLFGHSLGASTVLGLTWNSCCQDDRIDAVVVSGAGIPLSFPDHSYTWTPVPKLIVNGTEDIISPMDYATDHFDESAEPAFLLTIEGAGHFDSLHDGEIWFDPLMAALADFFDTHVAQRRPAPFTTSDPTLTLDARP